MFKQKHVFTCPDVIYLRNRQKKLNKISIALNLLLFGGMWAGGKALEAREARQLAEQNENPTS